MEKRVALAWTGFGIASIGFAILGCALGANLLWLAFALPGLFVIGWRLGPGPGMLTATALYAGLLFLSWREPYRGSAIQYHREVLFLAATGLVGMVSYLRWMPGLWAVRSGQPEGLNERLYDTVQAVNSCGNLSSALDLALIAFSDLGQPASAVILLYDRLEGLLRSASTYGGNTHRTPRSDVELRDVNLARDLSRGTSIICADAQKAGMRELSGLADSDRAYVLLPFHVVGELVGAIYLGYRAPHAVSPATLKCLQELADRIAPSVHRLRRLEELERLALLDGLTGLYNRHAMCTRLKEEIARALREVTPLTAVMVDLNRFKAVNDTHGHLIGDEVLRAVAGALRRNCRQSDVLIRFGGDEFLALCPQMCVDDAEQFARRLRVDLSDAVGSATGVEMQVSVGIASYPSPVADPERLVKLADAALYRAKLAGGVAVASLSDGESEFEPNAGVCHPQPIPKDECSDRVPSSRC